MAHWRIVRTLVAIDDNGPFEDHFYGSVPVGKAVLCENPFNLDDHYKLELEDVSKEQAGKEFIKENYCPACRTHEEGGQ